MGWEFGPKTRKSHIKEDLMRSALFAFFIAALSLMGCNTMQGVGKDVQKGGEAIEKAAE